MHFLSYIASNKTQASHTGSPEACLRHIQLRDYHSPIQFKALLSACILPIDSKAAVHSYSLESLKHRIRAVLL